jgi:putative oxidoreductase
MKIIGGYMHMIEKMEDWADHHHPFWIDFFRILLGLFLIVKAVFYIGNGDLITALIKDNRMQFLSFIASQYIIGILLIGGILIAFGLITRIIVLFELPILIASVFFIHLSKYFSSLNADLIYSILTLFLLLFFLFYGSGPFSADNWLEKTKGKYD